MTSFPDPTKKEEEQNKPDKTGVRHGDKKEVKAIEEPLPVASKTKPIDANKQGRQEVVATCTYRPSTPRHYLFA